MTDTLRQWVAFEQAFGVEEAPARRATPRRSSGNGHRATRLAQLAREAHGCTACPLYQSRTHLVFGDGHPEAQLVFVGEAPGRDEDRQGKPFVGAAGQLLTKMIEAIGLKREDVYIANVLKDRPPSNRQPLPEEMAACRPWLEQQLEIIQPQVICALGRYAAMTLVDPQISIMRARGAWAAWRGIPVMPTLHPAYLLRNPDAKKLVWKDLKAVRDRINQERKCA